MSVGLFYLGVYLSTSTSFLVILSLLFCFAQYWLTKSWSVAFWLTSLVTLPFAKGKGTQIILIPKETAAHWAFYDVALSFNVYLADLMLFLSLGMVLVERWQATWRQWQSKKLVNLSTQNSKVNHPLLLLLLFPWIIFTIITLFGSLNSAFSNLSLFVWFWWLKAVLFLFSPLIVFHNFYLVAKDQPRLQLAQIAKLVAAFVVMGGVFQSVFGTVQWTFGGLLGRDIESSINHTGLATTPAEGRDIIRVRGTFFDPSIFGTYLLMCLSILVGWQKNKTVANKEKVKNSLLIFGLFSLFSIALLLTWNRYLYLILGIICLWSIPNITAAFIDLTRKWKILISLTLVVLSGYFWPYLRARAATLPDTFSQFGSGSYRVDMFKKTALILLSHPWGVGLGFSAYYLETQFYDQVHVFDITFPHNLTIQLGAETGWLGMACWVGTGVILVIVGKKYKDSLGMPFLAGAGTYFLCAQMYPLFLNQPEISDFFFMILGLGIFFLSQSELKTGEKSKPNCFIFPLNLEWNRCADYQKQMALALRSHGKVIVIRMNQGHFWLKPPLSSKSEKLSDLFFLDSW